MIANDQNPRERMETVLGESAIKTTTIDKSITKQPSESLKFSPLFLVLLLYYHRKYALNVVSLHHR